MGFCITGGSYNMTMDVAVESIHQNEDTGQIERSWSITRSSVPCSARGLGNLRGKQSGSAQEWKNVFTDYNFLRIKTQERPKTSDRIVNIRDAAGDIIWVEDDGNTTIFEVVGVSPSMDPFGQFWEYEIFANRASVQESIV